MNNRDLLIRIDERVKNFSKQIEEHSEKIDKLNKSSAVLQTQMKNHVNMHKRDIALIGVALTLLTIFLKIII